MKNKRQDAGDSPPVLADRFLGWFCDPYFLPDIQGDLYELYYKRLQTSGLLLAQVQYCIDVIRTFRPYALRRDLFSRQTAHPIMFQNYFKSGYRHVRSHLGYSFINLFGLAVGIACCLLILLYVHDELSFDRHHEKGERIYRVLLDRHEEDGSITIDATTPSALAPALERDIPGVEQAVRILPPWGGEVLVCQNDVRFYENRVYMTDDNFFDIFTFPFVQGNHETVLSSPDAVVLTQTTARKYFGDRDPMGQILSIQSRITGENLDYIVTGVLKDLPENLHFTFDILLSIYAISDELDEEWAWWNFYTYALLRKDFAPEQFVAVFPSFIERYQEDMWGESQDLHLQAVTEIHLHSNVRWEIEANSDIVYVYIFSAVALLLLLIACANFTNLSTARSTQRAAEVGIRKVIGARRSQLIRQFLLESAAMSLIALLLAVLLIQLALPAFNQLSGKDVALSELGALQLFLLIPGFVLLIGLIAGSFPAFVLSRLEPVMAIKGYPSKTRGVFLRKGLVVIQFGISVFLIVGALAIHRQLTFIQNKKLGFDKEQVVVIPIRSTDTLARYDSFKQTLTGKPGIAGVTASSGLLGGINWTTSVEVEGIEEELRTNLFVVDYDFVETLGMRVTRGRSFSRDFATDSSTIILNEAALRQIELKEPLGKQVGVFDRFTTIAGVVEDFHFQSLHHQIEPFVLVIGRRGLTHIQVKVDTQDMPAALSAIQDTWSDVFPDIPFDYQFLDQSFSKVHEKEQRLGSIFRYFSILTIFIACLGLFGLAAFSAERRKKEVGVRKVMGASVPQILTLLSKDFLKLVFFAFTVTVPIAYLTVQLWLEGFAYRTDIQVGIFLYAGLATVGIALMAVGYQAARAAYADPVRTLRYE